MKEELKMVIIITKNNKTKMTKREIVGDDLEKDEIHFVAKEILSNLKI